jgi:hypothetical protein
MKAEEIRLHFQKLNEQRIELALIDDLKKSESNLKKLEQIHLKEIADYRSLLNKMRATVKSNTSLSVEFLNKIQDAEKMAKELGLNANSFLKFRDSLNSYYDVTKIIDNILK